MKSGQKLLVDGPKFKPIELKKHKSKIEKVIILTDSSNISAAETFILFSKGISNKVVTIGTHTGGVVDYNNINMISVGCKKQGIQFGYPTYTFHRDVVNQGYNDTGIAPDILINSASENALQEALNYLKK
jgi:C-terminal processing protease CtpA/Prc